MSFCGASGRRRGRGRWTGKNGRGSGELEMALEGRGERELLKKKGDERDGGRKNKVEKREGKTERKRKRNLCKKGK